MRGSVAFQAALGLLWTSSPALVGAAAIEPVTVSIPSEHVHVATAVAREEASVDAIESEEDEAARAIMKFEFPLDPSSGDEEGDPAPFFLTLEVNPTGSSCGPANVSINGVPLALDDEGAGKGFVADGVSTDNDKLIEATWSVHCLTAESESDSSEPSQLMHFDVTSLDEKSVPSGTVAFVAQFRQTGPAEILSVAGSSVNVRFEGAYLAHAAALADERSKSMLSDIARLEMLRHQVKHIESAIVTLEQQIAESYGVNPDALGIEGVAAAKHDDDDGCTDGFKCTVDKVVHSVSGTARKIYDQLFGPDGDASTHEKNHDETVLRRPPQHPMVGGTVGTSSQEGDATSHEDAATAAPSAEASSGADRTVPYVTSSSNDPSSSLSSLYPFLPAIIMIITIIAVLHIAARRHRSAVKEEPDTSASAPQELGFFARIAERRRRRKERSRRIRRAPAAVGEFIMALFRVRAVDAEKESERLRILDSEAGLAGPSTTTTRVPRRNPNWMAVDVEAAPFTIGDSSDDDGDETPYARELAQPRTRFSRDAESITLVGSERSDEDDAASESGSVSSREGSDSGASTTMEMDLARFREATFMVGNLVGASSSGGGRPAVVPRRMAATPAPMRRAPSPSGSLPGYASDDPYPVWDRRRRSSSDDEADEMTRFMVADGFRYAPGAATVAPGEAATKN